MLPNGNFEQRSTTWGVASCCHAWCCGNISSMPSLWPGTDAEHKAGEGKERAGQKPQGHTLVTAAIGDAKDVEHAALLIGLY